MNQNRKIIIFTKGMDGSNGISRMVVSTPHGKRNIIEIFTHHRDFIDAIIDSMLYAKDIYQLVEKLREALGE